jgi:hypothetical protein
MRQQRAAPLPIHGDMRILRGNHEKAAMINGTGPTAPRPAGWSAWFDMNFYRDVTGPLLHERMVVACAPHKCLTPYLRE